MPTPLFNETKKEFLKRCIPQLIKNESRPQKQSVAICANIFDRHVQKEGYINLDSTEYLLNNITESLEIKSVKDKLSVASSIANAAITQDPAAILLATDKILNLKSDKLIAKNESQKLSIISKLKKPNPAVIAKFDDRSTNNKFNIKPTGIIIQDTYNNPIFPIDYPIIDDAKFNLPDIKSRFRAYYCSLPIDFLPWHYTIEIINGTYYFFNTRPIDMKYPVDNIETKKLIEENKDYLNLTDSTINFLETQPVDIQNAIHVCLIGDTNRDVYVDRLYEMIGRICCGPILRFFKLPASVNLRVINFNLGNKFIFNKLDLYLKR